MKKVLIALDYDPTAQKVAETGFSLAKTMDAKVILLHVISDPIHYSSASHIKIIGFAGCTDTTPLPLDSPAELRDASLFFLDNTKRYLGDETIQILVKEGDMAATIMKTAENMHVSVIVMGSHSRKCLENIVMGGVTEEVLNNTSIPLFIVPTKKHDSKIIV